MIHIHPGQQMLAAAQEIDLANLEPPEPEAEDAAWVSDFAKLPESLVAKRACINIQNQDCRSFQYAVVCFLDKTWKRKGAHRISKYIPNWPKNGVFPEDWVPRYKTLGLDFGCVEGISIGLDMTSTDAFEAFEQANPGYKVWVYQWKKLKDRHGNVKEFALAWRQPTITADDTEILMLRYK